MAFFDFLSEPHPAFFTDRELSLIRNTFNCLIKKYDDYEFVSESKRQFEKIDRSLNLPNLEREVFSYQIHVNKKLYTLNFSKGGIIRSKHKTHSKNISVDEDIQDFILGEKIEKIELREIVAWIGLKAWIQEKNLVVLKGFFKQIILQYSQPEHHLHLTSESRNKFKEFEDYYLEKFK